MTACSVCRNAIRIYVYTNSNMKINDKSENGKISKQFFNKIAGDDTDDSFRAKFCVIECFILYFNPYIIMVLL